MDGPSAPNPSTSARRAFDLHARDYADRWGSDPVGARYRRRVHQLLARTLAEGAHVLDLGCGDGTLLKQLVEDKNVQGYGLEIDHQAISTCVASGINVIEQHEMIGDGNLQRLISINQQRS